MVPDNANCQYWEVKSKEHYLSKSEIFKAFIGNTAKELRVEQKTLMYIAANKDSQAEINESAINNYQNWSNLEISMKLEFNSWKDIEITSY